MYITMGFGVVHILDYHSAGIIIGDSIDLIIGGSIIGILLGIDITQDLDSAGTHIMLMVMVTIIIAIIGLITIGQEIITEDMTIITDLLREDK
jgi:hypothetical protein